MFSNITKFHDLFALSKGGNVVLGYFWYLIVKHLNTDQNDMMLFMQYLYVSHMARNANSTPLMKFLICAMDRVCKHYFAYELAGQLLIALHILAMVHYIHYGCE